MPKKRAEPTIVIESDSQNVQNTSLSGLVEAKPPIRQEPVLMLPKPKQMRVDEPAQPIAVSAVKPSPMIDQIFR